jgi:U3 small nucleolar RNA-associated protein 4
MMSWWDREISIWKIPRHRAEEGPEDMSPEASGSQGRKLVAKVILQGEESITSADLSSDGSILLVSTMAELKFFNLRQKAGSLKVQKLQAPAELDTSGAKSVHISPDKKWLAIIRSDNRVQLYRMKETGDLKPSVEILSIVSDLKRLPREFTSRKGQPESLGNYNRYISQLAFSSDSRILAVADISGYMDTWVLEGHEDLTQDIGQSPTKTHPPASSDSDSDSDSDEEYNPTVIFGQHWIRNPSASLLIKLPAAPLVFSFRPSSIAPTKSLANGSIAPHPTRHTPHPHTHDLPAGEDRLFVLTAENQMYEFNVLAGKISDWSRRNPTSSLPREFRDLRDRAMGAVWDVKGRNERVWIHGVNWLWMFDLSRDMPGAGEKDSERSGVNGNKALVHPKRKRGADRDANEEAPTKRSKHDTGAGSKIRESELGLGIGRKIRKIKGAEDDGQSIDLDREQSPASDEDEDAPVLAAENDLVSLRRSGGHIEDDDGLEKGIEEGESANEDNRGVAKRARSERLAHWHTYKYRPILGIVPLGGETDDEGEEGADDGPRRGLEVALVERPLWDLDLPAPYYGDQEWNP